MAVNFAKLSEMLQSALRDGFGSGTVQRIKREMEGSRPFADAGVAA
jgi:hypothetical protein